MPPGCPFHPRCALATKVCRTVVPALIEQDAPGHLAACHHSDEAAGEGRGTRRRSATARDAGGSCCAVPTLLPPLAPHPPRCHPESEDSS